MKGLTPQEFAAITEFVQKHHKFGYVREEDALPAFPHGLNIKYIDSTYDTRDGVYWVVTLRQGSMGLRFSANHFVLDSRPADWPYDSLYEWIVAYLTGEWSNEEEEKKMWVDHRPKELTEPKTDTGHRKENKFQIGSYKRHKK